MATAAKTPKTVAARKAGEQTAVFVVISSLHHDGVEYDIGDEVELTERQALDLIGHTVIAKAAD